MVVGAIKKIILLGAGGFLGTKLKLVLSKKYDVSAYQYSESPKLDVTDRKTVLDALSTKPGLVINASGLTDVDLCETNKELAYKVNVDGTKNIVDACNKFGIKPVHYSTDAVFDGKKGDYTEEDKAGPLSYYAKTKLMAEEYITKNSKDFLILRVAILYGYNGNGTERSFVKWVYESLKQGKKINVVVDQQGTPTLVDDIAEATDKLIKKNFSGIYHVAGSEKLSRYDMAVKIAEVFGFDKRLIAPIKNSELKLAAPRPLDTSLCINKLLKQGITMHGFNEGIKIMKVMMK